MLCFVEEFGHRVEQSLSWVCCMSFKLSVWMMNITCHGVGRGGEGKDSWGRGEEINGGGEGRGGEIPQREVGREAWQGGEG